MFSLLLLHHHNYDGWGSSCRGILMVRKHLLPYCVASYRCVTLRIYISHFANRIKKNKEEGRGDGIGIEYWHMLALPISISPFLILPLIQTLPHSSLSLPNAIAYLCSWLQLAAEVGQLAMGGIKIIAINTVCDHNMPVYNS